MTSVTVCFCGKEFESGPEPEVSPHMFYVSPRTCSSECHNKWVLGSFGDEADYSPVGAGWMPIVLRLNNEIKKLDPNYVITQVKEKFGTLRFYAEYSEPELPLGITREEVWAIESVKSDLYWKIKSIDNDELENTYEQIPDWKHIKMQENITHLQSLLDRFCPIAALIRKAEDESSETCEWCGQPGELDNSQYWLLTLCDGCKSKRQEKK